MEFLGADLLYILQGFIFYAFGLKWCYEYAKPQIIPEQQEQYDAGKIVGLRKKCCTFLRSVPLEGILKLTATAIGLAGTLTTHMIDFGAISPKVANSTIYLFFAFSGLIDVLNFYFPYNVGNGLVKMGLVQSFFVEGFLFMLNNIGHDFIINIFIAATAWMTSIAVTLELVWPEAKLLRATMTLLQGTWTIHMVRASYFEIVPEVALVFTWHLAAAFAVILCVVAVTRSCTSRMRFSNPPEIPVCNYQEYCDKI
ncbi:transmembrane protein 45B isoform X1 [Cephus cinctus]|uniref:Transmembrane protein 45B isoform X1 n=1 Tax=Cephus cinctus TaxID=211228 RepID=A0AAJ7CBY7_CEPCN|nr:transmembrane protein 45B isoform X1 [Cephus cinctus]XP_015607023.1 transmembrane protein 45B isoform X1 [Cephus cinctus]XP_024946470.1 transmembrane protein 45B isoform X1 [Cephus cinctus]